MWLWRTGLLTAVGKLVQIPEECFLEENSTSPLPFQILPLFQSSTQSLASPWTLFWSFKPLSDALYPHLALITEYTCICIIYLAFNHVCISDNSPLVALDCYLSFCASLLSQGYYEQINAFTCPAYSSGVPTCARHCSRSWEIRFSLSLLLSLPSVNHLSSISGGRCNKDKKG